MRAKNGHTVRLSDGSSEFVPIDVLCLIAGVNFGSAEKLLAAIHVVQDMTGADLADLASFYRAPVERVNLSNPDHAVRATNTSKAVSAIVGKWTTSVPPTSYEASAREELENILHLSARFDGG